MKYLIAAWIYWFGVLATHTPAITPEVIKIKDEEFVTNLARQRKPKWHKA
jgi:hypothetical protein